MPTYNIQNEQVTTDNTGKAVSTAQITGGQKDSSGAYIYSTVQTAPSIPYTPPNPNTPVPATDLSANTVLPPKAPTYDPTPFVGSVADSMKYFQDLYNKQTAQYDAAQKERDSLKNVLGESYGLLNSMPDAYKQQEQQMGIPQMYQDLNNLNLQIADLTGAYDKEFARVETKGIQSGTPGIFYQGEQAAIQRQKAVEIGALGIRQAAMAGNLDLANQRLQKTIELQFAPIENKIKQTMQFLELNADDMTAAERRQSESLKLALAFQEQQLTQQKEDRSNALMAGVKSKFFKYTGSDTVYDTTTGKALTPEQYQAMGGRNFTDITEFSPAEVAQVHQLIKDYGDAGILPSDSLAVAMQKLNQNSKKYRKETYIAGTSGGSGSGIKPTGTLQDLDILAEAVSNKLGSVAAKTSFIKQYNSATTEDQKLKILASNVVLPNEIKTGIVQNTQVMRSLDDALTMLDKGVQTGLLQAGQSYVANKLGTGGDKQVEAIKSKLVAALQPYRNKVTGAAWGTQEENEYQTLIGSVKYTPEDLRNKLEVFKGTLREQSQAALLAGIDPLGAINQNSVIQNSPALTTPPSNASPEQQLTTPENKSWWSKTTNWLWGD